MGSAGIVDDVRMGRRCGEGVGGLGRCGIPGLASSWSLLASQILLGEALLPGFALPVVISNAPAVDDDPAAKLPEHGLGRHDGDLPRSIGVG